MFRFYSSPLKGVRVSVVAQHSEGVLKVAVSRCSKHDQFVKSKGRAIAEARLEKGKYYTTQSMVDCTVHQFRDIAEAVSQKVAKTGIVRENQLSI